MSQKIKVGVVGKSQAFYTNMEARIKAQVIAEIQREYPAIISQSDTVTAIFYEGAFKSAYEGVSGRVLLTTINGVQLEKEPAELNEDLPEWLQEFFESDEFTKEQILLKDKNGNNILDENNNTIYETKTKLYNHPVYFASGVDLHGNRYQLFSIAKYGTLPSGYNNHHAFIQDDNTTYFDYIYLSSYPLSEITDGSNNRWVGSFSGKTPISEVQPETRIQPERSYYDRGMRFEMNYFAFLCTVIYGDRGMGYQNNASLSIQNHFCGNALDVNGVKLNSTGNVNEANNFFCVNKTTAGNPEGYADIQIGADVTFLSGDLYLSYGNLINSNTSETRKVTAKEDMGTYWKFTFDGDPFTSYNKYLHCNYLGKTGVTDSINHISGYRTEYPKGYQPFKLLNIENPFGMYATWLDWLYSVDQSNFKMFSYGSNDKSSYSSWTQYSNTNVSEGWLKEISKHVSINAFLPSAIGADEVTYYGSRYFKTNNTALIYGRDNRTDYKHGSLHSFTSCIGNFWTSLASNNLSTGCWGRVYRSASH